MNGNDNFFDESRMSESITNNNDAFLAQSISDTEGTSSINKFSEINSELYDKISNNQSNAFYSINISEKTKNWEDIEKAYLDVQKEGVTMIDLQDDD
jgi:hypothetical protein